VVLIDTNILAYLLLEGDRTALAQELYERDSDWCSEAFLMVEFSNVLATSIRSRAITREQGVKLLAGAEALVPVLTSVQHERVLEAAIQFGTSAYDARFIALAMQMKIKLVTEDARLRSAVPAWTNSISEVLG
jgi:predicted nucleic acid-binding protein